MNNNIINTKAIPKVSTSYLLCNIFKIKSNLLVELTKLHDKMGDVFGIQADNLKCFIRRPDLIKHVLVDNHTSYEKGVGFILFHNIVGQGLLTSDGEKWITERKVLGHEFLKHNQSLNSQIIHEELEKFNTKWANENLINLTYDLNELIIRTTCRMIFQYDFTESVDQIRKWFHDYDHYIGIQQRSFIKLPINTPLPYLKRAKEAIVGLRSFAASLMQKKLESPEMNMIKRMKENNFSEESICDNILTFFIAGHESTANSINFTFLLLRDNPKYFDIVKKEISTVKDFSNIDELEKLQYLDLIIKESLRLYPTIPLFPRVAKVDDQLGEYHVKKGDLIALSPWIMHRSEKHWTKPLEFYPERFIELKPEREFIYFPFGLGPRKCIGASISNLQMKKIISYLFSNYSFDITGPSLDKIHHNVSLSPISNVFLKLKK